MLLIFLVFFLLLGLASTATVDPEPTSTSDFEQFPSHHSQIASRDAAPKVLTLAATIYLGTDKFSTLLRLDDDGTVKISTREDGNDTKFSLNGNTLKPWNTRDTCLVENNGILKCYEIHEFVPKHLYRFFLAANGTLVYKGSANWWTCDPENTQEYAIYSWAKKISPDCEAVQLQSVILPGFPFGKKSSMEPSTEDASVDHTRDVLSHPEKTCVFNMRLDYGPTFYEENKRLQKIAFYWLGKRLGTGPNGNQYCYINAHTRKLDCADKSSQDLMENFHTIDFSINPNGYLMHNGSENWVWCKTSKGWDGPYDDKKVSDANCEANQVQVMVGTIPGHDCRSKVPKLDSRTVVEHVGPFDLANTDNALEPQSTSSGVVKARDFKVRNVTAQCPSNLVNTLFKSPMLVVPVSSINRTQSFGSVTDITITPTQNSLFKFVIPYTRPYYNKTCALLLLLPEIELINFQPQAIAPALEFSMLEGSIDEQTTWENMPKARSLVKKVVPNEIRPGGSNFITTFPCDSGSLKSFMISSRGGLSLKVKQGGVPNESGLHLVPCV